MKNKNGRQKYEEMMLLVFEDGGCCCPEKYEENGRNCPSCEWFDDCGEGQAIVNEAYERGFSLWLRNG